MTSTVREGVDFSYDPPTGAQIVAAGKSCAMVYITDPGHGNKGISQERYDNLAAEGIAIGFVWELGEAAVLKGFAQGAADAKNAQANLNALRGPSNSRPLYFAIDFDIEVGQYAEALSYFQGVNSVIGKRRTGVYGHADILDYLKRQGVVTFLWQTCAWSGDRVLAGIQLLQYDNGHVLGTGTVDYCRMYPGNWGQLRVLTLKPAPKPVPVAPRPDPVYKFVIIKPNDTLGKLAKRYGHSVTTLAKWNHIANPDVIFPGTRIRVD